MRAIRIHLQSNCIRLSNVCLLGILSLLAVTGRASKANAGDTCSIWATDHATQSIVQCLMGPETEVRVLDETMGTIQIANIRPIEENKVAIFVVRGQMNPMTVERLRNQGCEIQVLNAPKRSRCFLEAYTRFKEVCDVLVRCYPKRALEFQARLERVEAAFRNCARGRAIQPSSNQPQA